MIVLSVHHVKHQHLVRAYFHALDYPEEFEDAERSKSRTTGGREDHVRVFGGGRNRGDPALVAGHRAEVAEGFHGVGVGRLRRRRRRC